jgi:predicted secreted protein
MATNGNTILVYLGSTLIGGIKSNDIETDIEMIEVSSPSSGTWREYRTGRKEWKVSVNYLVLANSSLGNSSTALKDLLCIGNSYTLKFMPRNGSSSNGVEGTAILKTCKVSAAKQNLVTGQFTFIGNGQLS